MRFPSGKLVATKLVMSSNEVTHLRVSLLCSCWASHCATVRVIMAAMLEFCGMLRLFNSSGILALWNNIIYVSGPFRKKKNRKKKHSNVMSTPSHHRICCKLLCIIMMYTCIMCGLRTLDIIRNIVLCLFLLILILLQWRV